MVLAPLVDAALAACLGLVAPDPGGEGDEATIVEENVPAPAAAPSSGPKDTEAVGVVEEKPTDPTVFPDPRKFSRGFFAEIGIGPGVQIGPTRKVLSTAFAFSARSGYEIRRWIAVQLHATGTIARYDDGVFSRELFAQGIYTGELRAGVPFRRFLIAAHGGAGVVQSSNNLLQIADIAPNNGRLGIAWDAGLTFDVHSLSRHFSGGLTATFVGMPQLSNAGLVLIQLYVRYSAGTARQNRGIVGEKARKKRKGRR